MNYIAFVIPAFFLFLGLEFLAARKRKKQSFFTYENSLSNISVGLAERLLNISVSVIFYACFDYIYANFAMYPLPNQWWVWLILLLFTDFIWYWYHRFSHEVNILWAAHIVHHHSEDFNYTVSARITVFQALVRNVFWCFLPFIGFPPYMVITVLIIHGAYSFFTHTRIIGKLGFLEHIFITPSHHRVHHASNEKYLDKNYGDIFIFWDKLFGTFANEREAPVYGLTHPLNSHSFLWQHFHYYIELVTAARRAHGFGGKLKVFFGRPDEIDPNIRPTLERRFLPHKFYWKPTFRFKAYLNIQFIIVVLLQFLVTLYWKQLDTTLSWLAAAFILVTLINCGALLEQRKWIHYLEYTRFLVVMAVLAHCFFGWAFFLVMLLLTWILEQSLPMHRWYYRVVYPAQRG